ncbi:hypothetical protein AWR36_009540 [Microbulbifer flavimaris]|uniref:Tetratricopeptide repeat-containing protein n=1 Tax=Microbulbifer flavimaris TaxID=1781068 RepID=A0ABX4HXZ0_9GAMM|nr:MULTISPECIES: hypothetical protein [Microbulbifer]KUJ82799.1 hypothetical protein AVO43_09515 [Microbulbifer sp. ZGT114]PCO04974.1 hypothetical protein AWR36_009540 [Microbulbifer flavimaris]
MAESCNYHSSREAGWHCQPCKRHFCADCVPGSPANYPTGRAECPLCHKPLADIAASNSARPFWQMGAFFFRYALHPGPLTVIGLATGASLLISGLGLISLLLLLAAVALLTRYNLLVIEHLAHGKLQAPEFGEALDGRSAPMFLKVIAMALIAGFGGYQMMRLFGEGGIQLYSIALSLLAPAAMIVLALEGRLRSAVNPLKLLHFTVVIGWPYLLLWLSTTAVSAAPQYLMLLVAEKLPAWAIVPVIAASTSYFYIVTSAMMGYICLGKQQSLGISPSRDDDEDFLEESDFDRARALAEAQILMREGEHNAARRVLVDALRRFPNDAPLNERYYRLLLATHDQKALRELAPHLLEKLINLNHPHRAAELYLATEPQPAIDKSSLRHGLADALYRHRKFAPAARLLNNLHKDDSHYRNLDKAYLLLAKVYLDGFNREDLTKQLLVFLRKKYPDSEVQSEVRTLAKVLQAGQPA